MARSIPDDVLICIAAYLSNDDLQALITVHPAFCHLAMHARYAFVFLTDRDTDRPYLLDHLARLRDPFVSSYVRSVVVKLDWKQRHWKKSGGMVTQRPTPSEEHALTETLACLSSVSSLSLKWTSRPDAGAPVAFFAAISAALAQRLLSLALHAPVPELCAFVDAVDAALLGNIEQLDVFVVSPRFTQPVDSLAALGRCIAVAGSARLLSLRLVICPSTYWSLQNVITSCFIALSNSRFERLRTLELSFPFQGLSEEGGDALLTIFHHIAPTLEAFSLDVFCMSGDDVAQRRRWVERWNAPLPALRKLKLSWPYDPNDLLLACLPWIQSSGPRLSELNVLGPRFTPESMERLMASIASSCPRLHRLQLTIDQLLPKSITLLATACPSLVELDLHFYRIGGGEGAEADVTYDGWWCRHDLWQDALEKFADGSRACTDRWGLKQAVFTRIRHGGPCEECGPATVSVLSAALRHFASAVNVSVAVVTPPTYWP